MRPADRALYAACAAAPTDDGPRLVLADALGGDRGELVVVQCDLACEQSTADRIAYRRRERELLAIIEGDDPVDAFAIRTQYERGFVTAIQVELATLAANTDAIVAAAPLLTSLTITGLAGPVNPDTREPEHPAIHELLAMLETALTHPALARITAIDLVDPVARDRYSPSISTILPPTAELIQALPGWALPAGLRSIGFSGRGWGPSGALPIARIAALQPARVWLRSMRALPERTAELLGAGSITSLELTEKNTTDGSGASPPLFDLAIEDLALSFADDALIYALADSNAGRHLRHLVLDRTTAGDALAKLGALPNLETLDIGLEGASYVQHEAIVRAGLPKLRELRIATHVPTSWLDDLTAMLGEQLDVLSLAQVLEPHHFERYAKRIPGDVLDGDATIERVALIGDPRSSLAIARRRIPPSLAGDTAFIVGPRGALWRIDPTDRIRIGRGSNSELRLFDGSVARTHCELRWGLDAYHIEDLGSTNGVLVNGARVQTAELTDGTSVQLGAIRVRYFIGDGAADRALTAARITASDAR